MQVRLLLNAPAESGVKSPDFLHLLDKIAMNVEKRL